MHLVFERINGNFCKLFIGNSIANAASRCSFFACSSLRKVKLDQRKLTDSVNAVSDIARVSAICVTTLRLPDRHVLVAIFDV
jgi:hypothetical protein